MSHGTTVTKNGLRYVRLSRNAIKVGKDSPRSGKEVVVRVGRFKAKRTVSDSKGASGPKARSS